MNITYESRTIRIFISSTFEDMKEERDYLITKIFPKLAAEAAKRDVTLIPLDLRWGISEEESRTGKVIEICLQEIEQSRPFFIGLLGNRYGWCPPKEELQKNTALQERYNWVEADISEGLSVTEMEIQYGALRNPEKIDAFLSQVLPSSPLSISVKIRLGYSHAEEVFPVVEVLNRYPLDYVAVHPRTGRQLYEGTADWEKFDQARRLLKHPCIYNGDVDSVEKAEAFAARFPMVRRVMIGRGVVADPFLPCRLSGFSIAEEEKPVYFARFVAVLWRNYRQGGLPEKAALQRQKLFWSRFRGDFVPEGAFEAVKQVENADAYEEVCRKAFGEAGMEVWEKAK